MSWQQDSSGGGYSNYGNYSDGQYATADSASYDMFEVADTNPQPNYPEPGFGSGRSSAFYDPNAYNPGSFGVGQEGPHHRG